MHTNKPMLQLSWSKLRTFLHCQRCFYKELVLNMRRPEIDANAFSLNNSVDILWKNEFDKYRVQQRPHPLMIQHNIKAIPFEHKLLTKWRNYKAGGIRFIDQVNNIVLSGVIDDLWINQKRELILVDYKATARKGHVLLDDTNKWGISNRRQMAF